ncbi:MAG TPA: hypothetical protein VGN12_00650 [Pirellulales bacterium]|jgi:hypothetical protein
MAREIDDNLQDLLQILPAEWSLVSYRRSPHGWTATLAFKNREFLLTSQFSYIDVAELIGTKQKKPRAIPPLDEHREAITASQVCQMLCAVVRSHD